MMYLLIVSFIWAFSFSLIKGNLLGLDPCFIAATRMLLSLLLFLPFLRPSVVDKKLRIKLTILGAFQYGVMYLSYIAAFKFLKAHQIAILTLFTPVFVTLTSDFLEKKVKWNELFFVFVAVLGSGVIVFDSSKVSSSFMGIVLMQLSNIFFAIGQVCYKKWMGQISGVKDQSIFAFLFLGAFLVTSIFAMFTTPWRDLVLTARHVWTLLYLGLFASGICFFLWNIGTTKVSTVVLAIFNNLKIPLAVMVSLLIFGEGADILRLIIGGSILVGALTIATRLKKEV